MLSLGAGSAISAAGHGGRSRPAKGLMTDYMNCTNKPANTAAALMNCHSSPNLAGRFAAIEDPSVPLANCASFEKMGRLLSQINSLMPAAGVRQPRRYAPRMPPKAMGQFITSVMPLAKSQWGPHGQTSYGLKPARIKALMLSQLTRLPQAAVSPFSAGAKGLLEEATSRSLIFDEVDSGIGEPLPPQ